MSAYRNVELKQYFPTIICVAALLLGHIYWMTPSSPSSSVSMTQSEEMAQPASLRLVEFLTGFVYFSVSNVEKLIVEYLPYGRAHFGTSSWSSWFVADVILLAIVFLFNYVLVIRKSIMSPQTLSTVFLALLFFSLVSMIMRW